ncbi:winged helix-turn-helix transcriptional regulator [Litorivivens sp.]|uniref:winged helix-turn-helix transcriptional regulator n=1 Tax=Litorivivens sp. TaxID=2020868 RepID=UPI003569C416
MIQITTPGRPVSTEQPLDNPLLHARAISRALGVVGDRSSLLLTYWVFLGRFRFTELVKCTGLSKSLVSNRLKRLAEQGVIERRDVNGANEFHLTDMGKDLYDVALAIIYWDKRWHFTEGCLTHHLTHAACGKEFSPVPSCAQCEAPYDARACDWHYGPGAPDSTLASDMPSRRSRIAPSALDAKHPIMDRSLEILGDRWTALTIAAAFYRVRTFGGFQQALGIATNILSSRLSRLTELGIFTRNEQGRGEYRLTEEGLSLFPVIVTLMRWGDRWFCDEPALVLSHRSCNQPLVSMMVCDQCGGRVGFGDFYV